MSDVQALLSVDAGRVPPGTVAFFARDPERTKRRILAVLAVLVGSGVVASVIAGLSRPPIALLALCAIALFVMALPPERDPETEGHKRATLVGSGMVASLIGGLSRPPIALLALATIGLFVMALPPERDPETAGHKRATLVLTPNGMIVRDNSGLRSWCFDDLVDVRPFLHQQRIGLLIARRDGGREFVDTLLFKRGEKVNELIGRRLKPREA
jgi:hypothetical protein